MCALVTVIIAFHNEELFLAEAIESVLAQSYSEWALVLVDDGSTDTSASIAQQFVRSDARIKYAQTGSSNPVGISGARNRGLAMASGQYIAFLDADDIWLPDKLTQQIEIFNSFASAMAVYGRTRMWFNWRGSGSDPDDFFYSLGVGVNELHFPPDLFKQLLKNKVQTPTTCNIIFRREFFDQFGCFESKFKSMYEDQVIYFKLFTNCPVFVSSKHWANYRQHPDSVSANAARIGNYYRDRLKLLNWLSGYLYQNGLAFSVRFGLPLACEQLTTYFRAGAHFVLVIVRQLLSQLLRESSPPDRK